MKVVKLGLKRNSLKIGMGTIQWYLSWISHLASISNSHNSTTNISKNKMNCELMLTYDTPAYMFNVYKNQLSLQTGIRNLMGPKMLTTIWGTYMKLVTKYQIPVITSC